MDKRDVVRDLVAKLIEAVEASLDGSPTVREALDELLRNGFEPRLILLADATARSNDADETADDPDEEGSEAAGAHRDREPAEVDDEDLEDAHELQYEMTKLDRDFLRTVRIRPESG